MFAQLLCTAEKGVLMKKIVLGRPPNKIPSEGIFMRLPRPIAKWFRRKGSKDKVVEFIEREIKKK